MQKRLLLINPWIYDFTAYDLWSKPLGLLYIASFLRDLGYHIDYIDCLDKHTSERQPKIRKYGQGKFTRTEVEKPVVLEHIPRKYARFGISVDAFRKRLLSQPAPDAVLVTSLMTYWYPGPQHVVELIREIYPGVPVILGGIYATLLPDHAKKTIKPDFLVTGPGELKVASLLADIFGAGFTPQADHSNLDHYPYPAFDLVPHPDYLLVMTARGCPYDCSFCAQKQIAMRFTQRDPMAVVEEIVYHYQKFHLRDFAFYDDALFIRKEKHIQVILEELIRRNLPIRFHSPNGLFARYIDKDLAQLMFRSNFKTIRLSFETSNEARRKDMYSKVSNEDMIAAVDNLHNAGYANADLDAYVLMGLPNQPIEEIIASLIFVNNLGVQSRLASFSPIPGTKDFHRAVEAGLIAADIDPLLTNKSIFPLHQGNDGFSTFRKLRQFSHMLNEAARRDFTLFSDEEFSPALTSVIKGMQ